MYYTHDEINEMMKAQADYDFQPRTGVGMAAKTIADAGNYRPDPAPQYDNTPVLHESGSGYSPLQNTYQETKANKPAGGNDDAAEIFVCLILILFTIIGAIGAIGSWLFGE